MVALIYIKAENFEINTPLIDKPFLIYSEGTINSLIENAGDNILFKVGELIGTQTELYHTEQRKYDIELLYNSELIRTINIHIPEGYFVKNLNDINIDFNYTKNYVNIYNFTSAYEIHNDTLKINIVEFYREINCQIKNYDDFSKVVNASADFNKLTLLFQRK